MAPAYDGTGQCHRPHCERGREVNEFLENELGREGLAHSVVVIATSNHRQPSDSGGLTCLHHCRALPGSGAGRALYDGLRNPICHGCQGNWARRQENLQLPKAIPECLRPYAATP